MEIKWLIMLPLLPFSLSDEEDFTKYKLYSDMSSSLKKYSNKARLAIKKKLDKFQKDLPNAQLKTGRDRDPKKLAGTSTVYYMRSGEAAHVFFQYSKTERNAITNTVLVATPKNLSTLMKNQNTDYISLDDPMQKMTSIILLKIVRSIFRC